MQTKKNFTLSKVLHASWISFICQLHPMTPVGRVKNRLIDYFYVIVDFFLRHNNLFYFIFLLQVFLWTCSSSEVGCCSHNHLAPVPDDR